MVFEVEIEVEVEVVFEVWTEVVVVRVPSLV